MPSDSESNLNLKIVEMAPSREDASLIRVTCIDSDSAEEPSAVLVNCQTRSQLPLKNQEGRLGRPSDEDPGGRVAQETVTVTAALSVRVLCTVCRCVRASLRVCARACVTVTRCVRASVSSPSLPVALTTGTRLGALTGQLVVVTVTPSPSRTLPLPVPVCDTASVRV